MEVGEPQKRQIQNWLIENGRKCPVCQAGPENLFPHGNVTLAMPPEATEGIGIDTSYADVHQVNVKCGNCGFDKMFVTLEEIE